MKPFKYGTRTVELFYHYRKKSTKLPYPPVRVWVELTSFCNYKCIMCPNKDLQEEEHGFMDFQVFKKILDEAEEFIFDANLAHRGESLLHPQLGEMIDYAKKKHLFTRLHTNGSLLTEEISHKIISVGLDRLSFSLDGYDKETYEKIRKGGDFHKTLQNIVRFLEIKKEGQSKKPETSIEFINFNHKTGNKLSEAKKRFKNMFKGLPSVGFETKDLHNWAGETEKKERGGKYCLCPFPWNTLIIFWDGAVLPCTQDFFGNSVLGNVKDSSLREIWNTKKMIQLRRKLVEGDIDDLKTCSRCDRLWRSSLLGVPREYLWKFLTHKMP